MPQGRRKVPFSAKQKKLQLQNKRKRKANVDAGDSQEEENVKKINEQPLKNDRSNVNRYALQFHVETKEELQKRKELARQTISPVPEDQLEIDVDEFFLPELDFPQRPPWSYEMGKEQLELRESNYFKDYISSIKQRFNWEELSYFELNLETWRQLWRVLEMSDIILLIVDIRYPALMFPPSLYNIVQKRGKEMILVLNKIDMAPVEVVVAWKHYFLSKFPSIHVVTFTSYPSYNLHGNLENKSGMKAFKRRGRMRMAVEGAEKLLEICSQIVKNEVDLNSWKKKISEEKLGDFDEKPEVGEIVEVSAVDTSYHEHVQFNEGVLTIGCVGQPNAGKSSVINALMGKKVVSVSKTPGHTKHFQTIFLTPTVKLCDCPGLVFPSKVPKVLQVLMGSFPIAQLRDPYSGVRYLAERMDLVKLLRIQHPDDDDEWSAVDICDGWAKQKGFYTARTVRPDTYRAANHLLRLALDGKICLCLRPCGYASKKEYWKNHPEVGEILHIQSRHQSDDASSSVFALSSDEEETAEYRDKKENSDSAEDSDDESDSEDSPEALAASNKFAALADSD
ncbi:hypothetical protein V9T40_013293 [Parthenolecanium corni]|uniref:Guanine nucleotide-binding protein-like 1 n=1 Tax=Parthenolecanium corni TaxID=536013 RepID=A0AAN9Y507_9HEMI